MSSRQLKALRKAKHELKPMESSSSSEEEEEEEEIEHVNPFAVNSGSSDEEAAEGPADSDVDLFELPSNLEPKSTDKKRPNAIPSSWSDEEDDDDGAESDTSSAPPPAQTTTDLSQRKQSCFTFRFSSFDPENEMALITSVTSRRQVARSLISRRYGWLCPKSELLTLIEQAQAGRRWESFDPKAEKYFVMSHQNGFFSFLPTERYLATFNVLEEMVALGDINMLHEFVGDFHNCPFHPAGNLSLSSYYIQNDQADKAFQFICRALSAFQISLNVAFNPTKFDPHEHLNDICQPPLPTVKLQPFDEREIAASLLTLSDDLQVDWNSEGGQQITTRQIRRDNRDRELEVRSELQKHFFGTILFLKTLHMYAWALGQRGCPRTAMDIFRLIHAMTLGNDVCHALLMIPDLCVRAKTWDRLCSMNDGMLPETLSYAVSDSSPSWLQDAEGNGFDRSKHPFVWRLDFCMPQFAYSSVLAAVRMMPGRICVEERFLAELDDISAEEFWQFIMNSGESSFTTLNGQYCWEHCSMIAPLADEFLRALGSKCVEAERKSGAARNGENATKGEAEMSSTFCHLLLLRSLWLFPAFAALLLEQVDSGQKKEFTEELLRYNFFNGQCPNMVKDYFASILPADNKKRFWSLEENMKCWRTALASSYCRQAKDIWAPMVPWLRRACKALNGILEKSPNAPEALYCQNINFQNGSTDRLTQSILPQSILPHLLRPACQLSIHLAFPAFVKQYIGVRESEFDPRQPTLPNILLNSSPEHVGSAPSILQRQQGGEQTPLQRWWADFATRTGRTDTTSNAALVFLRALLPWSTVQTTPSLF